MLSLEWQWRHGEGNNCLLTAVIVSPQRICNQTGALAKAMDQPAAVPAGRDAAVATAALATAAVYRRCSFSGLLQPELIPYTRLPFT